jgi:hypothetical protein
MKAGPTIIAVIGDSVPAPEETAAAEAVGRALAT